MDAFFESLIELWIAAVRAGNVPMPLDRIVPETFKSTPAFSTLKRPQEAL